MNHRILALAVGVATGLLATNPGYSHSGSLDANGCHYEAGHRNYHCHRDPTPSRTVNAPVKKSRENICHPKTSPNWSTLKYFIAYKTMEDCVRSGGRRYGS